MNCDEGRGLLHPFIDGELDVASHVAVEAHLERCAACAARAESLRSLRKSLASPALYHRVPASLHARLLPAASMAAPRLRSRGSLFAMAASLLLLVGASMGIGVLWTTIRTS